MEECIEEYWVIHLPVALDCQHQNHLLRDSDVLVL